MKNTEIAQRVAAVLNALNSISVSGKQNLAYLSGSITVLEEVQGMLQRASEETAADENEQK